MLPWQSCIEKYLCQIYIIVGNLYCARQLNYLMFNREFIYKWKKAQFGYFLPFLQYRFKKLPINIFLKKICKRVMQITLNSILKHTST